MPPFPRMPSAGGWFCAVATLVAAVAVQPAKAADYEVKMLNHSSDGVMRFAPELLRIAPGDTVHFVAVDKDHNVRTIPGMTPTGAKPFASATGEGLSVTLTVPGIYGYRCDMHESLGMVGLIVVGAPVNEDAARNADVPGLARQVFAKLFAQLDMARTTKN